LSETPVSNDSLFVAFLQHWKKEKVEIRIKIVGKSRMDEALKISFKKIKTAKPR
jgi:hypothetical protein